MNRERWLRRGVSTLGWLASLLGALMVALQVFPRVQLRHPYMALAASFIPYGTFAWAVATLALVFARRWWVQLGSVLTVAALLLQLAWTRPYWPWQAPTNHTDLTVMTQNTYYGWANHADVLAALERYHPDIVVLSEATMQLQGLFDDPRWQAQLPYHVGAPGEDWHSNSLMVFSRVPLTPLEGDDPGEHYRVLRAELPSDPVSVIAVHADNPTDRFPGWVSDLAKVRTAASQHTGPLVVLGDFNAVREHAPLRDLLSVGLTDAAEQSGAGFLPTYRANRWLPALIRIDHVLVDGQLSASWMTSLATQGTDHWGLVAGLART